MIYSGTKSLDAEIHLDFEKGVVVMDYSSNSKHLPYDSNISCIDDDTNEWLALSPFIRVPIAFIQTVAGLTTFTVALEMATVTFLQIRNAFPHSFHHPYQAFLKWYYSSVNGIYEDGYSGELHGTVLKFNIEKNIWFLYEMSGDYEKYITHLSLTRRIVKFHKMSTWSYFVQRGWVITMIFSQPPNEGTVKIEYI